MNNPDDEGTIFKLDVKKQDSIENSKNIPFFTSIKIQTFSNKFLQIKLIFNFFFFKINYY